MVAYRIRAVDEDWVLRVPKRPVDGDEVARQTCWYRTLSGRGLPLPHQAEVIRDDEGNILAGLYRYVDGQPARRPGTTSHQRACTIQDLADFLSRLHALPAQAVTACGAEHVETWSERYQPLIARYAPTLGPASCAWLTEAAHALKTAMRTAPPPVPIHGDLQPEHVLTRSDGSIAGILDPSGPLIADPALDFGRIAQFFDIRFADDVLSRYAGVVDRSFRDRMLLYADLQCLLLLDAEEHGIPAPLATDARRQIAARAASARRRHRHESNRGRDLGKPDRSTPSS